MKNNIKKIHRIAFTLIELLVVIAIIGILSGLIVISMSGVTQKATMAKAQVFSNSLRNSLMMNLLSEWKLNGNANDSWGLVGGVLSGFSFDSTDGWRSGTQCASSEGCLQFGGNDYINFGNAISKDEVTVSFWANRTAVGTQGGSYFAKGGYLSSGFATYDDTFTASSSLGVFATIAMSSTLNKWENHTLVIRNSSPYLKHYINGVLDATGYAETPAKFGSIITSSDFLLGYNAIGGVQRYFNGFMDDMRIYNVAMTNYLIKEQYYFGLNELLIKGKINKGEYLSRINSMAKNE
ncbi:MAG: LamG-like jellyroll fold domain-containing protein [Candidatus Paceibacterota bacterium]|jgi:prepilin-type N-terminal cleavage/methylation domain-containing protein